MSRVDSVGAHILSSTGLGRFIPEPRNSVSTFGDVLGTVGSALSGVASMTGVDSQYVQLIQAQLEAQMQMQQVSMVSNIEKSKHETQMAAIRNVRVG